MIFEGKSKCPVDAPIVVCAENKVWRNCQIISKKSEKNEEGVVDMCKAFADERKAGKREGKCEEGAKLLGNYMKNKNVSLETAMRDLGIPLEEKEKYLRYFKEENKK